MISRVSKIILFLLLSNQRSGPEAVSLRFVRNDNRRAVLGDVILEEFLIMVQFSAPSPCNRLLFAHSL